MYGSSRSITEMLLVCSVPTHSNNEILPSPQEAIYEIAQAEVDPYADRAMS